MQRTALLAACSFIGLAASGAYAQNVTEGGIPEIIVTAQKRAENSQSVPIAMAAVSGDSLADARILETRSLQNIMPSLQYGQGGGFAIPYLRGVGNTVLQPGAEPSVATFVDGVYVVSNQGTVMPLLGVDRVEVLAGPQGTLYGRNATGGAINIYSLTPSQQVEAKLVATGGNRKRAEGSGHISGPLSDSFAVGLYAAYSRRDSFLDFSGAPPSQADENYAWGVRFKSVFEPTDGVKFIGSVEYLKFQSVDGAYRNVQPNSFGIGVGGNPAIERYHIFSDTAHISKPRTFSAVLREEFDLGFADLVGITGYRRLRSQAASNIDGVDAPLVDVSAPIFSRQFSQEVQILSKPESPIQWITGLYYLQEHGGFGGLNVHSNILFGAAPFNTSTTSGDQRIKSYAAFAQATIPLADTLKLTLGGRYTIDKKVKPNQISSVSRNGTPVGIPDTVTLGAEKTWHNFSPKITVEYQLDHALLYATYSKGFKSGQFQTSSAPDIIPANPEKLTAYEAGLKSDLLDRRLRLNTAFYYYDFRDLQVQVLEPGGGVSAVTRNAARAEAYGAELWLTAAVTDQFTIDASMAYEHSKYKSFANAPFFVLRPGLPNIQSPVSATGNPLVRAPEFVGTLGATYAIPLGSGGTVKLHSDLYYNGGFYFDPVKVLKQDKYALLNASVTYVSSDEKWSVSVWGTNITDSYYIGETQRNPFGTIVTDGERSMFGLTLSYAM